MRESISEWQKLSFFEQELLSRLERIGYTIGGIGEDGFFVRTADDELISKLKDIDYGIDRIVERLDVIANVLGKEK